MKGNSQFIYPLGTRQANPVIILRPEMEALKYWAAYRLPKKRVRNGLPHRFPVNADRRNTEYRFAHLFIGAE